MLPRPAGGSGGSGGKIKVTLAVHSPLADYEPKPVYLDSIYRHVFAPPGCRGFVFGLRPKTNPRILCYFFLPFPCGSFPRGKGRGMGATTPPESKGTAQPKCAVIETFVFQPNDLLMKKSGQGP